MSELALRLHTTLLTGDLIHQFICTTNKALTETRFDAVSVGLRYEHVEGRKGSNLKQY